MTLLQRTQSKFNYFIRLRDSLLTSQGTEYCQCCTCRTMFPFDEIQSGHYLQGLDSSVRFNEVNAHGQCYVCNVLKSGNLEEYDIFMKTQYSNKVLNDLYADSLVVTKLGSTELREIYEYYSNEIENILHNQEEYRLMFTKQLLDFGLDKIKENKYLTNIPLML